MALEHGSLSPRRNCQENVSHKDKTGTTSNELDLLFSPMFDELLNGSSKVVSKSSAVSAADAPNQRQQPTTPLNNHTTPAPTCQTPPITTSSEQRWTKDHPLEQVIGNPSQSVRTRRQLESDAEMCMFALTALVHNSSDPALTRQEKASVHNCTDPALTRQAKASVHNSTDPALTRQEMASVQNSTDPGPTCQRKASVQISSDPAPECQTTALEHNSLSPGRNCQEIMIRQVVSKSSAVAAADAPTQRQQPTTPLNNHTTPVPTCQNPPITTAVISSENITQAEQHAENDQVADDEYINIFSTPVQDQGETSSRHVDSSNMHTFPR
nr:integrase, catalytic region, zinc finger, CCHC-type, peptidase aspartic, catalytic [Tanacetum cinerariifolium]